ncbi:hypothetical protein ANN_20678 [Periplaneta americana]|uniref:Uncharacterized protein n=1 Tax=Periplaneta americana TaxID=6978 RepID=A0ABQ8SDY5_PERAM|nr:hypothetical protein ANN_20678 [Periplaneta americana]
MAGLCEGGNEPSGSLKAIFFPRIGFVRKPSKYARSRTKNIWKSRLLRKRHTLNPDTFRSKRNPVTQTSYNGWGAHRANHTIPPFWLDDRPPLLRHVGVRPAVGWSVLDLRVL